MEESKQKALDEWIRRFDAAVVQGRLLRNYFMKAGLSLDRLYPVPGRRTWLVYLQPSLNLRRRFDLAPEILAVVSPYEKVHAQELDAAANALRETHRLDRGLVLFFSDDPSAARELDAVLPDERATIFFHIDDLLATSDPEASLRRYLAAQLGSGRPFAPGSPVSDWQFFGRQTELLELERRLLETTQPVALFGLRKMGKTSLIRRLQQKWRDDRNEAGPRAVILYCDLQSIPFTRRSLAGLMRKLLEEIRSVVADNALLPGFRGRPWTNQDLRQLDEKSLAGLAIDALDDMLSRIAERPSAKLVVAIDEYERLLNEKMFPRAEGLDFLDMLRGYSQQQPRAFSFLVAGLDRRWALQGRYEGRQNPLYGGIYQMPLAGFSRQELGNLMRKLGRRAGLDFTREAIDRIAAESGGHPYIARLFADIIDQGAPSSRIEPIRITDSLVGSALPSLDREAASTMIELADTISDLAQSSEKTAPAVTQAWMRHIDSPPPPALHDDLVRYGLVEGSSVRIGAFARWARQNFYSSASAGHD